MIALDHQLLIIQSVNSMLSALQSFQSKISFPHVSRTGMSETQLFELLAGLDPAVPYMIKNITTTTTTDEDGQWLWTFFIEYTCKDRQKLLSYCEAAENAASFLAKRLFHEKSPDYVNVFRAVSFLAGSLTYTTDTDLYPFQKNAYGAFVDGKASCKGYAHALSLLLKKIHIPCQMISGSVVKDTSGKFMHDRFDLDPRTKASRHYWNLVGLETTDGIKYFHIDTCWCQSDQELNFSFLFQNDHAMQTCLKWEESCYSPCEALPGADMKVLLSTTF